MAGVSDSGNGGRGVPFLVAAGIFFEIVAFACSSPQTAELNIKTRADTLMKWVHLGEGLGVMFVVIAAISDRPRAIPILWGGAVAGVAVEVFYRHAKASGMAKPGPMTEQSYSHGAD